MSQAILRGTPLRIKLGNGIILLNLLVLLLIAVLILSPSTSFRIVLGLPFLLFLPGYALLAALYPKKEGIDAIERVALSFALSIALVPLIGLILNYTPWGIRLESVLYSVALFIFITSIVAMLRRAQLPEQERFCIEFWLRLPGWSGAALNKSLSIILLVSILGVLGTLGYVIAIPKVGERLTEFYILGPGGTAEGYPTEFVVNGDKVILVRYGGGETQEVASDSGRVILGIVNQEHENVTYLVWVMIDGEPVKVYFDGDELDKIGPIELVHGEKWEHEIGFAPQHVGDNQKVEFVLYQDGARYLETPPYLWLNVKRQD
jgi:uncharacterized membrane protein